MASLAALIPLILQLLKYGVQILVAEGEGKREALKKLNNAFLDYNDKQKTIHDMHDVDQELRDRLRRK